MSTDEPAWKAELNETLDKRFPFPSFVADRDEIREFVADQIRAAEERGRRETLRRAAEKIRRELPETVKERLGGGVFEIRTVPTARQAADLIDPDVP